jgi:hypothetical protein
MTREQLQERLTAYGPRATQATLIALCALVAFGVAVLPAFLKALYALPDTERSVFICSVPGVGDRLSAEPVRLRARRGAAARAGLKSFPIEPVRFSRARLTKSRFPRRSLHWSGQTPLP